MALAKAAKIDHLPVCRLVLIKTAFADTGSISAACCSVKLKALVDGSCSVFKAAVHQR